MPHMAPVHLYKYKSLGREEDIERVIDIITNSRIYASTREQLNDPMEGVGVLPTMQPRCAGMSIPLSVDKVPDRFMEDVDSARILSLTESATSPQMWAYYGDGYKGVCLQFDTLFPFAVYPVHYTTQSYGVDGVRVDGKDGSGVTLARLLNKHIDWSHEREWRAVFLGDEQDRYAHLGDHNHTAVIIGHLCDCKIAQRVKSSCKTKGIPVYSTYIADLQFRVRIVPYGFSPELNMASIESQLEKYSTNRSVPLFEE